MQAVPLREFALTEMRSDNTRTKTSEGDWAQFESFTVQSTNQQIGEYWAANYNVAFRANTVLANLEVVNNGNLRNQLEGEAKFARAYAHFNLVRAFGDVPKADRVIGIEDTEFFVRVDASQIMSFVAQDLADASVLLPSNDDMPFGRATRGAASGLLAKVHLNLGNYGTAESLLEPFINGSNYSLMSEYSDIFYNEGNNEILFAIPYLDDDINESQDFSFEMTVGGQVSGLNYLTDNFQAGMDPLDTERTPVIQNPLNADEVAKYLTASSNARLCGNDWIVLRLADVYLLYVEAKMAGLGATQNLDAINAYNLVRARVGLEEVPVDGTGEITLENLLNERRYELSAENHRLYDLVRTGQAVNTLNDFADEEGWDFSTTDLLLPIPLSEINVSDGLLTQNPGYN